MNAKHIAAVVGMFVIGVTGCSFADRENAVTVPSDEISVVASFYPVYFFAQEIGGGKANVINIAPDGVEPHDYEPTPQEIAKLESANLIVLNGGGLEPWGDSIEESINPQRTVLVDAAFGLTIQNVVEDGEDIIDPHVWLSPTLAQQMVDKIEQGYKKADPVNADYYSNNASNLKTKLRNLDAEYKQGLSNCEEKDIITSHAAFGYLAASYGLNQVSIAGISTEEEPSAQQLAWIVDFARENNVKYIFFESLVSPKLSQTIATEVGAEILVLDSIEGIAGEDIVAGKTYFSVMRDNLANLKIALQCTQ